MLASGLKLRLINPRVNSVLDTQQIYSFSQILQRNSSRFFLNNKQLKAPGATKDHIVGNDETLWESKLN